jgi:hypothetical protein
LLGGNAGWLYSVETLAQRLGYIGRLAAEAGQRQGVTLMAKHGSILLCLAVVLSLEGL